MSERDDNSFTKLFFPLSTLSPAYFLLFCLISLQPCFHNCIFIYEHFCICAIHQSLFLICVYSRHSAPRTSSSSASFLYSLYFHVRALLNFWNMSKSISYSYILVHISLHSFHNLFNLDSYVGMSRNANMKGSEIKSPYFSEVLAIIGFVIIFLAFGTLLLSFRDTSSYSFYVFPSLLGLIMWSISCL